jgi:serine protease Do
MSYFSEAAWRHEDGHGSSLLRCLALVTLSSCSAFLFAKAAHSEDGQQSPTAVEVRPAEITDGDLALVRAAEQARIAAIEKVYGSVVAIYGNDRAGGGSGVLIDPAGFAATNHHVVAAAGVEGWAGLADGKLYRWKLIGTDPGGDVAVIQLHGKDSFPAAVLADSDKVRVGDWSMAMGNPFVLAEDQRPTVTLGIVSGVKRYQGGEGMNQLVYGNCIQVDSSINPGNSGGPLFNLRGEVIGINGRGSFQERGRVNVGLGYAISSNQVKNFLPELLATKIAQHGTLDAQFGNRSGGVICQTLNLESPAARSGLQLGDRLVEFEGESIKDANQFTNLITTLPAGWPVMFVVERTAEDGSTELKTIHARLTALPYEPVIKPQDREKKPEDQGKPSEEKEPLPSKPEEGKKEELPPKPVVVQIPKLSLANAGKIRDADQNRIFASRLLERWRFNRAALISPPAIQFTVRQPGGGEAVDEAIVNVASDGRCHCHWSQNGKKSQFGCDGKIYWQQLPDKEPEEITPAKASRNARFSSGLAIASLRSGSPPVGFGPWQIDGSDKAGGQLVYRLATSDPQGEQFFIWLNQSSGTPSASADSVKASGQTERQQQVIRLVKSGVGIDDDEPIPSVLYHDDLNEQVLPTKLVRGLAEVPIISTESAQTTEVEFENLDSVDDQLFRLPPSAKPSE